MSCSQCLVSSAFRGWIRGSRSGPACPPQGFSWIPWSWGSRVQTRSRALLSPRQNYIPSTWQAPAFHCVSMPSTPPCRTAPKLPGWMLRTEASRCHCRAPIPDHERRLPSGRAAISLPCLCDGPPVRDVTHMSARARTLKAYPRDIYIKVDEVRRFSFVLVIFISSSRAKHLSLFSRLSLEALLTELSQYFYSTFVQQ